MSKPNSNASAPAVLPADENAIRRAVDVLRAGGLVAVPTETVYGLAADATNDTAVARIFEAKGRPRFNPLIVHVTGRDAAARHAAFDERADALAAAFWPGPLTLVLPRRPDSPVSLLCSAGMDSLAMRAPDHPVAQRLLRAVERPLAAPSANASGRISPTEAAHVVDELDGRVDLILDGGPCRVGLESTVLSLLSPTPTLLRPGGLPRETIEKVIGPIAEASGGEESAPASPGMLSSHYAPALPLRLNAVHVSVDEALLAFGAESLQGAAVTLNLSRSGDLTEAAAHLFAYLRALDRPDLAGIAAMPVPEEGLGRAINDRLRRAASPRA
jgi:L-threonylcarbamoyladenylate synthase